MKNRIVWIDIVKGAAIIAVVLLHIGYAYPDTTWLPAMALLGRQWHVPVFFFLSGYLLKEERLQAPTTFMAGKIRSLYLPLLALYIPAVLLHNTLLDIGWYDTLTDYGGKTMASRTAGETALEVLLAVAFAGREPILAAMWFVYVLVLAFGGLTAVSALSRRVARSQKAYERMRAALLLTLCASSCLATRLLGITVPRLSNTLTAMWLIYAGYMAHRLPRPTHASGIWLAAVATLYLLSVGLRGVALNSNSYADVATLTLSALCAFMALAIPAQAIERSAPGRAIACIGRHSFAIMALHITGFKLGQEALLLVGRQTELAANGVAASNLTEMAWFLACGLCIPLALTALWHTLLNKMKSHDPVPHP